MIWLLGFLTGIGCGVLFGALVTLWLLAMSDILERLRLRQSRIVNGTMHTCGDTCTHPDCLAVASLREIERLRFIIANYESRTASPALSVLALTEEINRLRAEVERLRAVNAAMRHDLGVLRGFHHEGCVAEIERLRGLLLRVNDADRHL